ncbi:hypothetical protein FisN_2Hu039 [Fistulifera solaris]|uniref:Uncharacterized protein n=1 Tax=Fistulifera solaris TaxID=1519565 RepID=A0A1Z5KEE5_FISSO|nr:hypothetical protein FisN_2Hu039 [Fistulifera solaris]|eukprot:GAX24472.1 hypothetical protein FisN_2Hu039 [Fistulifera solaris]
MMARWGNPDNAKLRVLFEQGLRNGGADPGDLSQPAIERVRFRHWKDRDYHAFAQIYRKKARAYLANGTLVGARRGGRAAAAAAAAAAPDVEENQPPNPEQIPPPNPEPPRPRGPENGDEDAGEQEEEGEEEETPDDFEEFDEEKDETGAGDLERSFSEFALDEMKGEDAEDSKPAARDKSNVVTLSDGSSYCLVHQFPYLAYHYVEHSERFVLIDFLVAGQDEQNFRPRVSANGKALVLNMHIPELFIEADRVDWVRGTGMSHHAVAALRVLGSKIAEHQQDEQVLQSQKGQVVKLPFEVERDPVEWNLVRLEAGNRDPVHVFCVLLKGVQKLKKRDKKAGYVQVVSPRSLIPPSGGSSQPPTGQTQQQPPEPERGPGLFGAISGLLTPRPKNRDERGVTFS